MTFPSADWSRQATMRQRCPGVLWFAILPNDEMLNKGSCLLSIARFIGYALWQLPFAAQLSCNSLSETGPGCMW